MTIVRNLAWICNRKSLAGFENERYKIWWVFGKAPGEYSPGNGLLLRETRLKVGAAIRKLLTSSQWGMMLTWTRMRVLETLGSRIYIFFSVKNHWMNQRGGMRIWKTMTLELHCACSREVSDRTLLSFLSEWVTLQIKAIVLRQTKKKNIIHHNKTLSSKTRRKWVISLTL